MQPAPMIHRLPPDVIAQIKSSASIISLNDTICGLVKNALDAQATKIVVTVDFDRGSCTVDDNGSGIAPDEFSERGGLGKLYHSSRFPPDSSVHGRHGTFLASLAALSLLTISSHHKDHHSHNSIRLHRAEVIARHTPALLEQRFLTFGHGTRVAVRDLFGTMPVRMKQRAIDAERGLHARSFESLKHEILALLLSWPERSFVSLRDVSGEHSLSIRVPGEASSRDLRQEAAPSIASRVAIGLNSAQLVDEANTDSWINLRASAGSLTVSGAVSLRPVATKRIQYISVGVTPIRNEYGSNVLYEEVNNAFANSDFGMDNGAGSAPQQYVMVQTGTRERDSSSSRLDQRGRKALERWPMFYLKILLTNHVEGYEMAILEDKQDTLAKVSRLLRAVLNEFLDKHHLQPRVQRPSYHVRRERPISIEPRGHKRVLSAIGPRPRSNSVPRSTLATDDLTATRLDFASAKGLRSQSQSPSSLWVRSKSGLPLSSGSGADSGIKLDSQDPTCHRVEPSVTTYLQSKPLFGQNDRLLRAPSFEGDNPELTGESTCREDAVESSDSATHDMVSWRNPTTGQVSLFDKRTGLIQENTKDAASHSEERPGNVKNSYQSQRAAQPYYPADTWLVDLMANWENPVFATAELPIPQVPDGIEERFSQQATRVSEFADSKISRAMLRKAEVISQIDRKFILIKSPLSRGDTDITALGSSLLIIDQHAADERCRVETLMRDYFVPDQRAPSGTIQSWKALAESLDRPLRFDISRQDAARLEAARSSFENWAIVYKTDCQPKLAKHVLGTPSASLEVFQLPPSIIERCQSEPRLLIDLLREEAWKLDGPKGQARQASSLRPPPRPEDATPDTAWISRLHGCPRGIMDMINSRACRSAIMFNDELSRSDCQDLVDRLARCVLPFQCAHGRPSMVPLLNFGDIGSRLLSNDGTKTSFGKAFRAWTTERFEDGKASKSGSPQSVNLNRNFK